MIRSSGIKAAFAVGIVIAALGAVPGAAHAREGRLDPAYGQISRAAAASISRSMPLSGGHSSFGAGRDRWIQA